MVKGGIYAKKGKWYVVVTYTDEKGKRKQRWHNTGLENRGNKKKANSMLEEILLEYERKGENKVINSNNLKPKMTKNEDELFKVGKEIINKPKNSKGNKAPYFVDWVGDYIENKKGMLEPVTYASYSSCYKFIKQYFNNKKVFKTKPLLTDITTQTIVDFYNYLKNVRGLKNTSIRHYKIIIHPALKLAYQKDIIAKNPAEFVPPLRLEKPEHKYYNQKEMAKFFEAIESTRYELPYKILAYYGLRRSELIGLKWNAIDFDKKTIEIRHKVGVVHSKIYVSDELKTKASRRTLPLIPVIENMLLIHKDWIALNRRKYGSSYQTEYEEYVLVDELGKLMSPDLITHKFKKIIRKHKLKDIRLHDLRHSCASLMVANKVPLKQVQEWLGHSNFATTADIYSHLDYSTKLDSARAISGILGGETKKQTQSEKIKELEKQLDSERRMREQLEKSKANSIIKKHKNESEDDDEDGGIENKYRAFYDYEYEKPKKKEIEM